jgi:transcription initiation factor TFIID subunit 7
MNMSSSSNNKLYRQLDEKQVILRLPPALATLVHQQLDEKLANGQSELDYKIEFTDNRHALFHFEGKTYAAVLLDLPCIVESSRLGDAKKLYKNTDVHQVLQVDPTPITQPTEKTETDFSLEDGITHVTKGAKTRFRKDPPEYSPERVALVEGLMKHVFELKYNLVKGDSAHKKVVEISEEEEEEEDEDLTTEQQPKTPTDAWKGKPSPVPQAPQENNLHSGDIRWTTSRTKGTDDHNTMVFEQESTAPAVEGASQVKAASASDEQPLKSEPLDSAQEKNLNAPSSPQIEPQQVLEAQRKAERFKLEKSIEAQQSKIRQTEEKISALANPGMKKRMQQHLVEMKQELVRLEEALEKHDKEYNA